MWMPCRLRLVSLLGVPLLVRALVGTIPAIEVSEPLSNSWVASWEPLAVKYSTEAVRLALEQGGGDDLPEPERRLLLDGARKCFAVVQRKERDETGSTDSSVAAVYSKGCALLVEEEEDSAVAIDPASLLPGDWYSLVVSVESGNSSVLNSTSVDFFLAYSEEDPWGERVLNIAGASASTGVAGSCPEGNKATGAGELDGVVRDEEASASALRSSFFDSIYQYGVWSRQAGEAVSSGSGSTLAYTANIRRALEEVIRETGVRRILDAPCGDMTWMQYVDLQGAYYTGGDVSNLVIQRNRQLLENEPGSTPPTGGGVGGGHNKGTSQGGFHFIQLDLLNREHLQAAVAPKDEAGQQQPQAQEREEAKEEGAALLFPSEQPLLLPAVDLLFVRDLMYHQSPVSNLATLANIEASGARLVMLSTHLRESENDEDYMLALGHRINLFKRPYCLRDPERLYRDGQDDRFMGLWDLTQGKPLRRAEGECD